MTDERKQASAPDFTRDVPFVERQRIAKEREARDKILTQRNRILALVLVALCVLFFAITIVKVKF
jgi:hypothetical protein